MTVFYAGDFETTTNDQETEVWLSCFTNVAKYDKVSDFTVNTDLKGFLKSLYLDVLSDHEKTNETDYIIFFHNLKFDGSFLLSFFLSTFFLIVSLILSFLNFIQIFYRL